jgi:phage gp46-like protein
MINDQPLTIVIDGQSLQLGLNSPEPLVRAVLISLLTWRRANKDDALPDPGPNAPRMGWWGDSFPAVPNDRIGSRLWLLSRAKLLPETVALAKEYAEEALRWLVDDGVAARVEVKAERQGLQTLALGCRIYKSDGTAPLDVRFTDVWEFLNV